ncbi:MAG: carboxypeptidase-like regulatory domain-containing protein, partial [Thermoanaerobaculia bacterium]
TDEEGRYRLEGVEPGLRMIGATTAEGRSVSHELDVAPGVNGLDLVFERGWPVSGVVLGPTGEPVAEALLVLAGDSRAWSGLDARSDGGGAFRFEDVADGTYWLRAEHPDHATTRLEEPVEVEAPVAGLELRMAAGTRLVGTLSGLEESTARRTEVFARDGTTGFEVASVAADGSFTIPALAPGEWTVMASAPDGRRATEIVSIAAGEREVRVDLSFIDGLTLTGTVLLAGEALTGARLVLRNRDIADSAWGRTDHRGRFEIRGLEPGRYGLVVSRFQDGLHHQEELSLSDDREVLIEIERHRVAGRVVDADGDVAVTDAVVQLRPRGADPALFPTGMLGPGTRSDSTGAFALGNVDAGVYEISALQDGYARLDRQLTVGPGDVEDLVLRLKRTEGALLRVLLPDAAAARSIAVVALDPGSGVPIDGGRFMATTAGDVRLASIPDGRWTLVVSSADAAVAEITVQVPGEAETVQLGPGTRLDVVVPALSGPVVPAATLTLQDPLGPFFRHPGSGELRQRWPIWNGRTTVENLPAGAWIVRVEATDGQRWDETVTVQAGGTQTVEIR